MAEEDFEDNEEISPSIENIIESRSLNLECLVKQPKLTPLQKVDAKVSIEIWINDQHRMYGPLLNKHSGVDFFDGDVLYKSLCRIDQSVKGVIRKIDSRAESKVYDVEGTRGFLGRSASVLLAAAEGLNKIKRTLVANNEAKDNLLKLNRELGELEKKKDKISASHYWYERKQLIEEEKTLKERLCEIELSTDKQRIERICQEANDWLRSKGFISNLAKSVKEAETTWKTETAASDTEVTEKTHAIDTDLIFRLFSEFKDIDPHDPLSIYRQLEIKVNALCEAICQHKESSKNLFTPGLKRLYAEKSVKTYFKVFVDYFKETEAELLGDIIPGKCRDITGEPTSNPENQPADVLQGILQKPLNFSKEFIDSVEAAIYKLLPTLKQFIQKTEELGFFNEVERCLDKLPPEHQSSVNLIRTYFHAINTSCDGAVASERDFESWNNIWKTLESNRFDFLVFLIVRTNWEKSTIDAIEKFLNEEMPRVDSVVPDIPQAYDSATAYVNDALRILDRYFSDTRSYLPALNIEGSLMNNVLALSNLKGNVIPIACEQRALVDKRSNEYQQDIKRSSSNEAARAETRMAIGIYMRCVQAFYSEFIFEKSQNEIERKRKKGKEIRDEDETHAKSFGAGFRKKLEGMGWIDNDFNVVVGIILDYLDSDIKVGDTVRVGDTSRANKTLSVLINHGEIETTAQNNLFEAKRLSLAWLNKHRNDLFQQLATIPDKGRDNRDSKALDLVCTELDQLVKKTKLSETARFIANAIVSRTRIYFHSSYARKKNVDDLIKITIQQNYTKISADKLFIIWEELASRVHSLNSISRCCYKETCEGCPKNA